MIKACIIDDKIASINLLHWLIKQHCPDLKEIKWATSVQDAIPLIHSFDPDIIFLDIQMPQLSGFDLLTTLGKWDFEVIFTTAFNEYAIQAIRFSALDYLLKPVEAQELIKAIERFKVKRIYAPAGEEMYRNFLQNISNQERKLALPGVTDIKYVKLDYIVRLQADRNYTHLLFTDGKEFVSSKTLKEYEDMLRDDGFVRVHRAHLINKKYIDQYHRDGYLLLTDGTKIEVSRRKKDQVIHMYKK